MFNNHLGLGGTTGVAEENTVGRTRLQDGHATTEHSTFITLTQD